MESLLTAEPAFFVLWPAFAATVGISLGLLLQWDSRWQRTVTVVLGAALLACCLLFRDALQASLAAVGNCANRWYLSNTGYYTPDFQAAGSVWPVMLLLAVIGGIGTGRLLNSRLAPCIALLALPMLVLTVIGWLPMSWYLVVLMAGGLLTFCQAADGKNICICCLATGAVAALTAAVLLLTGVTPGKTQLSHTFSKSIHKLLYEPVSSPMPEGSLISVPPYTPSNEKALKVTMQTWSGLYLRGFVGSQYTTDGWQCQNNWEAADTVYALQTDYFFPATQMAAAWVSVGEAPENTVTVEPVGACKQYTYLPYGISDASFLNHRKLSQEGGGSQATYTGTLYPVSESYLLQEQLSEATDYLRAEAVYRQWVMQTYLEVPEELGGLFLSYLGEIPERITTTQAKQLVLGVLQKELAYREGAMTLNGSRDFAEYLLVVSREGYSVHYATLATLMLRYCGIPARYVEGYAVTPAQVELMPQGSTLTLTQKNAHAWTEYYLDGVGWVPFDATPGYENVVEYTLPETGEPTGQAGETAQPPAAQEPPAQQPITQETPPSRQGGRSYLREAVSIASVIPAFLLVVLILRCCRKRKRLKARYAWFRQAPGREGTAAALLQLRQVIGLIRPGDWSVTADRRQERLTAYLPNGEQVVALEQELWYSRHPITEQQRVLALTALQEASGLWKTKTPACKRFWYQFVLCKIL